MFRVASQSLFLAVREQDPSTGPMPLARPDRPGRWELTLRGGRTLRCRVIDQNGELRAIRGGCLAVAVPVDQFDGTWVRLD